MFPLLSRRLVLGLVIAALPMTMIRAEVLVHDQFTEDRVLAGKIPMPGPGAAWDPGSATGINAVEVVSGEVVLVQTDGGTNGEDIANVFADQPAAGATYARFDFRLTAADNSTLATDADVFGEGAYFVSLRGTSASMTLRARFGVLAPASGGDFRVAINADSSDLASGAAWASDLAFDTTYRAIISYDGDVNGTEGESRLWINPTSEASMSVADAGVLGTVINRIILRQHNDYAGKQFIDNVVVATTFAEALSGGVANFLEADFNQDGKVDGEDLAQWRSSFGADAMGDADDDEDTDGADFLIWQRQLGQTPSPVLVAATAVPEPSSAILTLALFSVTSASIRRIRKVCQR